MARTDLQCMHCFKNRVQSQHIVPEQTRPNLGFQRDFYPEVSSNELSTEGRPQNTGFRLVAVPANAWYDREYLLI